MRKTEGRKQRAGQSKAGSRWVLSALFLAFAGCGSSDDRDNSAPSGPPPVDASTMNGKILWGYQGWFSRPADNLQWRAWGNWTSDDTATPESIAFDMWPDNSELDPDELAPTSFVGADGKPMSLYSNYPKKTTMRHFQWMQDYGIDGVFLQRFLQVIIAPQGLALRDQVTSNSMAGAEEYGRVIAVMYDLGGIGIGEVLSVVQKDWPHLVDDLQVTQSSRYLRHKGKPVVAFWGYPDAWDAQSKPAAVQDAKNVIHYLKNNPDPKYRATVMLGLTTTTWQLDDPDWRSVIDMADVVNPWPLGAYNGIAGADEYKKIVASDAAQAKAQGIDYMPVGLGRRELGPSPHAPGSCYHLPIASSFLAVAYACRCISRWHRDRRISCALRVTGRSSAEGAGRRARRSLLDSSRSRGRSWARA